MDESNTDIKNVSVYHWHNKTEGKEQYARFKKEFIATLKHLRYLLEPGGVQLRLGPEPGPPPAQAALRKEWREDKFRYDTKKEKIDEHFAKALGALESSFAFATTPRHIIDKVLETPPEGVLPETWTYRQKFEACWEALRVEFQPSNATDLSALREQIFKLTDEGPGGFDTFRAEFHRLMTEILATGAEDAITPRELNGIVREGIKNPTIWTLVCHQIYANDQNAPWDVTFEAISRALTSYRLKNIDPYNQAKSGITIGTAPASANAASLFPDGGDQSKLFSKRPHQQRREYEGRPFKKARQARGVQKLDLGRTVKRDDRASSAPQKCTRCWTDTNNHSFKTCNSQRCACGATLNKGQSLCFEYDNHPKHLKFPDDKVPKSFADLLEAFKRGKAIACTSSDHKSTGDSATRGKGQRRAGALAAQVAEELVRRGITGESLDRYN